MRLRVLDEGLTQIHRTIANSALRWCYDQRAGRIVWSHPMHSCRPGDLQSALGKRLQVDALAQILGS